MLRSLALPVVALFWAVPVGAQTTAASAPPPASKPQDSTAARETRKTRKVLTNEDLSKSTGKISVVGNGTAEDKPKAAAPPKAANPNPAYVASVRNQLAKLLKQMVDLDKQITDLKNFKAGEPSTNASGVQLDKRYEREPIEVQIRALQDKKKDLQSKLDALYDEARKKGVASGELP
jgi:chaperonin cofactor prefoldin